MITDGRVKLVALDRPHLARSRAWANDPELMRLMDRRREVSEAEHQTWFDAICRRPDCLYFAIETNDAGHVGNIWLAGMDHGHRKAELRIVIGDAAARGSGLGADAIDLLCRDAFDHLDMHRIYAYVLSINPGARRAFERAGFTLEGTLRDDRWSGDRFVDAYLLARLNI